MKLSLEFSNGNAVARITTEDDWEKKLLSALAKGQGKLVAIPAYKQSPYYSDDNTDCLSITLHAADEEQS